jgi:hypothetical protein
MAANSLKLSHKNKSPTHKNFMTIMDTLVIPIRLLFIHEIHGGMDKTESPNSKNNFYNFRINLKKIGFFINLGKCELEIHPYIPKKNEF